MLPEDKPNALWGALKERLDPEEFQVWLQPLSLEANGGAGLVLCCPNSFHLSWIRDNYLALIKNTLAGLGVKAPVKLQVRSGGASAARPRPKAAPSGPVQMELPRLGHTPPVLNQRFVFQNFVTGQCNEFACAAAKALASGQRVFANTLFMYSGTGLGKSHLTQAVGHAVLSQCPGSRVAYLTAEDFANQMISALRKKRIEDFKDRFRRGCDILLLEEVQFLAGKDKTQDELGFTLDALMDAGKRVVFTGSVQPDQLGGLKGHLRSRITAGITVPIDPPDHATRVRILEHLAAEEGQVVDPEVLEFLAQVISGDVRRLQSALVGLLARSSLTGRPLDLRLAGEVAGHLADRLRLLTPEDILKLVCKAYGLEAALLTGKTRRRAVARPRNLGMYLARHHTDASYAAIGKVFGRDHTTVMYGVDKVDKELARDAKLGQELSYLEQRLGVGSA